MFISTQSFILILSCSVHWHLAVENGRFVVEHVLNLLGVLHNASNHGMAHKSAENATECKLGVKVSLANFEWHHGEAFFAQHCHVHDEHGETDLRAEVSSHLTAGSLIQTVLESILALLVS